MDRRSFIGGAAAAFAAGAMTGIFPEGEARACEASCHEGCAGIGSARSRWYKGNLHTHTLVSDGRAFPIESALLYRDLGYDFLMFTDHNQVNDEAFWVTEKTHKRKRFYPKNAERFVRHYPAFRPQTRTEASGEVAWRVASFDETSAAVNRPGRFLLMRGCEYDNPIRPSRLQLHCNVLNTTHGYKSQDVGTLEDAYERMWKHYRETRAGTDAAFVVNHPLWWCYDVDPMLLAKHGELRFFEVYNNDGGSFLTHPEGYDEDRLWDFALAYRCLHGLPLLYGTATDDTHVYDAHYAELSGGPKGRRGWVCVRASELSDSSVMAALHRGDFYASSGVELEDVRFEDGRLSVTVAPEPGREYVIRFYGTKRDADLSDYDPGKEEPIADWARKYRKDGKPAPWWVGTHRRMAHLPREAGIVLKEVTGTVASYDLKQDDLYVRAKVTVKGSPDAAWVQPCK